MNNEIKINIEGDANLWDSVPIVKLFCLKQWQCVMHLGNTCAYLWQIRCSIVVSIPACHAGEPGSIPGGGVYAVVGMLMKFDEEPRKRRNIYTHIYIYIYIYIYRYMCVHM